MTKTKSLLITSSIVIFGSLILNLILFEIGKLAGGFGDDVLVPANDQPFDYIPFISLTLMLTISALVGYAVLRILAGKVELFKGKDLLIFNIGAIVVYVLMIFPPLVFDDLVTVIFLQIIHVATLGITILFVNRFGKEFPVETT
jgi:hypothetical protein